MAITLSQDDLSQLAIQARQAIETARQAAANSATTKTIKDTLISSADKMQGLLNGVLSKAGILSQEEYNAFDEQLRQLKENAMNAEYKKSARSFAITAALLVSGLTLLWYITKKQKI